MALDETLRHKSQRLCLLPVETSGAVGLDDDHSGVKWADIAGNVVMEMRIAFDGNANLVEAASIKGTTSVKGVGDGGSLADVEGELDFTGMLKLTTVCSCPVFGRASRV